ncbi:multidrug efflux pump [Sinobacterium caligoides]|uniref:Multidrug efflux pump n=1 Tax=Sinobacterium caligoides TaxID=933926 RepID=A0A3N2DNU9_9GAMM|nr:efflux RND transporter permease subunit [Sinobacterium caligoides]ROS01488.1 multidrug efflux pump [Sinobacterium caligoides]
MKFTDIFIRRPVLAIVVNLVIVVFGARAIGDLQVRQYPEIETGQVNITTVYPGADAELVQGFVTTPIQEAISSAEGIDYVTASSKVSTSQIEIHLNAGYDANVAMAEILTKVSAVKGRLPKDIDDPIIAKSEAGGDAIMYMAYISEDMSGPQVTDYLRRVVQPKLNEVDGVAEAELAGAQEFAMRIWLNPVEMRAFNITTDDINNALSKNNFQSAAGEVRDSYTVTPIRASTSLQNADAFGNIPVKTTGEQVVRLRDVARIKLGVKNDKSMLSANGQHAIFIVINGTPDANPLDVAKDVHKLLPEIAKGLPPGLKQVLSYDGTQFIQESIDEVVSTLIEAVAIVIVVVFLFLGSMRSVLIPIVTIPLSLIGVCLFMLMMGYSFNLLTLLAMVMAISLVVDDAIVVVENVHRHIEEGLTPIRAAVVGAREIATPVIAMTITLAAVYAPIGFMGGLTGSLFSEFAFTLAGAVLISGFIALTLSPMMSGALLNKSALDAPLVKRIDKVFNGLKDRYEALLHKVLKGYRLGVAISAALLLVVIGAMFMLTRTELAPTEDEGFIFNIASGPENAGINFSKKYAQQYQEVMSALPEYDQNFMFTGMPSESGMMSGLILKPWAERERSQLEIQTYLQNEARKIAGFDIYVINPPPLPGTANGLPVNFVLTTTEGYDELFAVAEQLRKAAEDSGMFLIVNNSLKMNKPQIDVQIDRDKAGQLGISMASIGSAMATQLGDFRTNYFDIKGRSYEVVAQAEGRFRTIQQDINNYYVTTASGQQVPLSTVITLKQEVIANDLSQFQQLNSATIEAMPMPGGATVADAHKFLEEELAKLNRNNFSFDFAGQSRQFEQEGSAMVTTFLLALVVIYLVLAAQFESFRDPVVVLITVPLSIFGAMVPLFLGVATLNIYTQVGLITLVGLISKHGILIVEFANQLQEQGRQRTEAVIEAAALRLRPILMTTAAMVLGVMPLVLATGAGAESRFNIGLVITVGMTVGTLFTLFVVPVMYSLMARQGSHQIAEFD